MSKKRAFVRYTKSGEIVPGSLIITTNGGYPDKSSLWQEVSADKCCGDICLPATPFCTENWAFENFDGTTFRNGDPIAEVTDDAAWAALTTPAWCYYDNDPANGQIYGKLYNWYAVNDPRGLAPEGWRVPSDEDYRNLISCLGGNLDNNDIPLIGLKLKTTGTKFDNTGLWNEANPETVTNSSGFSALPGGVRANNGVFGAINNNGGWWTSTEYSSNNSAVINLASTYTGVQIIDLPKGFATSVRLIKDI